MAYSKYHMNVIFLLLFYKMPQILLKIKMDICNYCHHHPKNHVDINMVDSIPSDYHIVLEYLSYGTPF